MKKFILLIIAVIYCTLPVFSQENYEIKDGYIVVENVMPYQVSIKEAKSAVKSYLVDALVDSNTTIKTDEEDIITAKFLTPTLSLYSMGLWRTKATVIAEVKFREGRMKTTLKCDGRIDNQSDKNRIDYSVFEAAPLVKHNIWKVNITEKAAIETFSNLINLMNSTLQGIEASIDNYTEEDDW